MQINVSIKEWQHMQKLAAIGELTTGIVHDLKNQFACIEANMSMIEHYNNKDKVDKYIANVKRQVEYTNEMIELMLKMGVKDITYSTFDLALLMDDVATFFQRVVARGITVKTYVDGADHLISGCQSLISNSILNLCANARDAIGEHGTIKVSLTHDYVTGVVGDILNQNITGKCSVLAVKDTGCGIASNQIKEIFEPFFTTKNNHKANAGMGLANVIHTAREHGASMTVESVVGVGTTFKLYFKTVA